MLDRGTHVMTELILPNGLNHTPTLERVNDRVQDDVDDDPNRRNMSARQEAKQHERRRLHEHVVHEHFPTLPLLHRHPLALEREVSDVVTRKEREPILRSANKHDVPPANNHVKKLTTLTGRLTKKPTTLCLFLKSA